jgi:hypothetical protein
MVFNGMMGLNHYLMYKIGMVMTESEQEPLGAISPVTV